jgi:hypothetical protein
MRQLAAILMIVSELARAFLHKLCCDARIDRFRRRHSSQGIDLGCLRVLCGLSFACFGLECFGSRGKHNRRVRGERPQSSLRKSD